VRWRWLALWLSLDAAAPLPPFEPLVTFCFRPCPNHQKLTTHTQPPPSTGHGLATKENRAQPGRPPFAAAAAAAAAAVAPCSYLRASLWIGDDYHHHSHQHFPLSRRRRLSLRPLLSRSPRPSLRGARRLQRLLSKTRLRILWWQRAMHVSSPRRHLCKRVERRWYLLHDLSCRRRPLP